MENKIFPRKLKTVLLDEIKKPEIVLLTGMRQVGKTTLLMDIFNQIESKNKIFIDLENPFSQKIFEEENFENVLLNLKKFDLNLNEKLYIFIDEIQYLPQISKVIKYLYDHYKIKFFLTGSSSFYLKNLFPESLAGRKINYELFPLTFEEFLIFKEKKKDFYNEFSKKVENKNRIEYEIYIKYYEEYLSWGGFPAVVLENNLERKKMILGDILKSYFEKDVQTLADFENLNKFRDTILLLASRVGSKIDISKIASEIGVSRNTLYSYLNFLEKTYFIYLISPFSKNINSEVRGAKKLYFCDNGILNYLAKISDGAELENAVFNRLKINGTINYYQQYKGQEIDFILNKEIAFEVKTKVMENEINIFEKRVKKLGFQEFYIISKYFNEQNCVILAQDL